jgi:hypothetical protein
MNVSPEPEKTTDDIGQKAPQENQDATKTKIRIRPADLYLNKWGFDTRSVIAHPSFWILIAILLSISFVTKVLSH